MFGKVGEGAVIGDDLAAVIRFHVGFPLLLRFRQPLVEILKTLLEICRIVRVASLSFPAIPLAIRRPLSGSSQ